MHPSPAVLWGGRVLTGLPALALLASGGMKLAQAPPVVDTLTKLGFTAGTVCWLGAIEVLCAVLFLVPQTAVLGAILATGYLGGAICAHVREGEPFVVPLVLGILLWIGLGLREPRLHALLPVRKKI